MNRYTVAALLVIVMVFAVFNRSEALREIVHERGARVAVVYTPGGGTKFDQVRAAYDESFREAGIPFDWVSSTDLALFDAEELEGAYSAIVFPDTLDRRISEDAVAQLAAFAALGGSVAVIGDAGSITHDGTYRPGSLFGETSGVDSFLYRAFRKRAFGDGSVHFSDVRALTRWEVPSGKTEHGTLSGYAYGPLTYPISRAEIIASGVRVDAASDGSPIVSVRRIGRGRVAYIGLPLGYLRTHSDAFPMTMLVSYLTRYDDLPHLVPAPDGVGELIVDIHIDSSNEFVGIPNLRHNDLLRHDVPMEFDVTAGPDLNRIGDGLGFDACGRGRAYLESIMPYGRIGSHGGWAHNLFAATLARGGYSEAQIRSLVARNDACLQSVTHVPVLSYAAPVGVHPQPEMTHVLDGLGILGYYYTGDTGAPVERPFYNGDLVSSASWAFPVMPLGDVASVAEMRRAHIPPAQVESWLDDTAAYAADQRGIYLFYSHSYDFEYEGYAHAMARFLTRLETMERSGRLRTSNMVDASRFMDRFMATSASFSRSAAGVRVRLENPHGLRSIAFAIPAGWIGTHASASALHPAGRQRGYDIFSVADDRTTLDITLPPAETTPST